MHVIVATGASILPLAGASVALVLVACGGGGSLTPPRYTVGGTLVGLHRSVAQALIRTGLRASPRDAVLSNRPLPFLGYENPRVESATLTRLEISPDAPTLAAELCDGADPAPHRI
jgi:hypothetical protein